VDVFGQMRTSNVNVRDKKLVRNFL